MRAFLPFPWDRLPGHMGDLRQAFFCQDIFDVHLMQAPPPATRFGALSYLLFTAANGIRAFLAQDWARDLFSNVPCLCVGHGAYRQAQQAGLHVQLLGPPPAADHRHNLPTGQQGLWISGTDVAVDFSRDHDGLARLPLYTLQLNPEKQAASVQAIHANTIRNIFITSAQIATWAGDNAPDFQGAAVLSPRLAEAAQRHLPHLRQVWTVRDLESGVRILSKSPC